MWKFPYCNCHYILFDLLIQFVLLSMRKEQHELYYGCFDARWLSASICVRKSAMKCVVSLEMIWPLWGWWSKNRFILDSALRLLSLWELRLCWYFIFLIFPFCHAKVSSILLHFFWFSFLKSIDIDELMISTSHL